MKKLSILFLSAIALGMTVTSCSKDEPAPSIVGKWTYDTYTLTQPGTATTAPAPANDANCPNKSFMNLKSGGVSELQNVASSTSTTSDPCAVSNATGTYTYSNNTLTLTSGSGSSNYSVLSIASNKLVIKVPVSQDGSSYINLTLVK